MEKFKKNIPNFLEAAQKAIDSSNSNDEISIKEQMIPILLSSYDDLSLSEIKQLQEFLKQEGYVNTVLIDDVTTKTNFEGKYDTKFIRLLNLSNDKDFFIIPIFYFAPAGRDIRLGHHSELVDLITYFTRLVFVTGLFYFKESQRLNQTRVIPFQNHFQVDNFDDLKAKLKKFVNSYSKAHKYLSMNSALCLLRTSIYSLNYLCE
ncbi:MAG: hypothetical protein AB1668_03900 [Nanoarchaeota archaeon]